MSSFHNTYEKIRKTLLSEQENQQVPEQLPEQPIQEPKMEPQIPKNEPSKIKNIEEDSLNVNWIIKVKDLLTLLNREDGKVQEIISSLSNGDVNADTLEEKMGLIEDLLRTIPVEKNI